ncbi:hypothetical protein SAMN02745121_02419 [Nannocystis exedens]|uniref:Uncharacterized protein n=1 Tax=Nannocystis exedens TaxID=54 RepID=A0A1I1WJR9_9BACT|nr:hypothetical protein NAEX_00791 [Nannocystis exedens]SFD95239.1 hypothetical protein SAMN02745121_02419 [Nannocystis exedens]
MLPGALVQGFPQPDGRRQHHARDDPGLFILTPSTVIGATLLRDVSIAPLVPVLAAARRRQFVLAGASTLSSSTPATHRSATIHRA